MKIRISRSNVISTLYSLIVVAVLFQVTYYKLIGDFQKGLLLSLALTGLVVFLNMNHYLQLILNNTRFLIICIVLGIGVVSTYFQCDSDRFYPLAPLLYFSLGGILSTNKESESIIVKLLGFVSVVIEITAVFGILEYIMKENPLTEYMYTSYNIYFVGTASYRTCSVFVHPIVFSTVLLTGFWINMFLRNCGARTSLFIIRQLMILSAILTTMTRSAWLITCITVLLYYIPVLRRKVDRKLFNRALVTVLVIMPCVLFAMVRSGYGDVLINRLLALSGSDSIVFRSAAILQVINSFWRDSSVLQIIFGNGYRTIGTQMSLYSTTDNQWVSCLYEFGVLYFIVWIIIFIVNIKSLLRKSNNTIRPLNAAVLAVMMMYFVFEGLYWLPTTFILFLLTGIIFGSDCQEMNERI